MQGLFESLNFVEGVQAQIDDGTREHGVPEHKTASILLNYIDQAEIAEDI